MPSAGIERNVRIALTCTECGYPFTVALGDLDTNRHVGCPHCGVRFVLEGDSPADVLDDRIAEFRRRMGRLSD